LVQIYDDLIIPVNNINIAPDGHITFCCAQFGDYGDFVKNPKNTLKNLIINPISYMLRNAESIDNLLRLVVELNPTIKLFPDGTTRYATGTTCYQFLTGKRLD